jgi:hypothetical protein
MFAGIISRDNGAPWGTTGLTSHTWLDMPVQQFSIRDLILTQPGVYFHALTEQAAPVGGDPYPHVVLWEGKAYLEDGHHRVMRALIAGRKTIGARVMKVEGAE